MQRKQDDRSRKRTERKARNEAGMARKRGHLLKGVRVINPYDVEFLRKFMTEHGKIMPSRLTGASSKQQREIRRQIRRNQVIGLLP